MNWTRLARLWAGLAFLAGWAASGTLALGQVSALDGFDPNANGTVRAVAVQADGRILIGGDFTSVGGAPRLNIARLAADGRLDTAFDPGANGPVLSLVVQADGKILAGGEFGTLGGRGRFSIGRLNPNGTIDESFNPGTDYQVHCLAVQPDGKIIVGGYFSKLGGQTRNNLGRLNSDGSVDLSFTPATDKSGVYSLAVQADGKILVGGFFTLLAGQVRNNIGRLNLDGSLDGNFNPGADNTVMGLAVQVDGKILIGSGLTKLAGQTRNRIGRLNADGSSDTSFNTGADYVDGWVNCLAVQADGRILAAGGFTTLGGQSRARIGRFAADGSLDAAFNPGADNSVFCLATQPDRGILVGGNFSKLAKETRNHVGRLTADGSLDTTFKPGAENLVMTLALQADGKILAGGTFTALDGQACARIGRLNVNGTLDPTFQPGASYDPDSRLTIVNCVTVQADQKILVGGNFTRLAGQPHAKIGRLNTDGSEDASFNPGASGVGIDNGILVSALAVQPDGKILVGGTFTKLNGQPRFRMARLNHDGSLDDNFTVGTDDAVRCLAVQADGKILVGGIFSSLGSSLGGFTRARIGRLNADGGVDSAFDPGTDWAVYCMAVQADGKILVGGYFDTLGGQPRKKIGRLNADGSTDPTFHPGADGSVSSLMVQADGRILVSGDFHTLGGEQRSGIGRLNADGSVDTGFNPGVSGGGGSASSLAVGLDGKILVGGFFATLGGQSRDMIGRLTSGGAALQKLEINPLGATLTWARGGSGPEIEQVTFERSPNASFSPLSTTFLGHGTRVSGGWQLAGLTSPIGQNFCVRARGRTASGSGGVVFMPISA